MSEPTKRELAEDRLIARLRVAAQDAELRKLKAERQGYAGPRDYGRWRWLAWLFGFGPGGGELLASGDSAHPWWSRAAGAFRAFLAGVLALAAAHELYPSPQAGWRMALVYAELAVILSYVGTAAACIARNTLRGTPNAPR